MATFFDLQQKNRKKTRRIVVCFALFFLWLGFGLDLATHALPIFTVIVGLAGVGIAWWSLSNAANTVLNSMLSRPADVQRSIEERTLVNIVEEMSIASAMPPPKVWVIPDPDPNALAVGLNDGDYHIAVTEGLLKTLNRDEIQGVIAHELAHLKNQDTRLMTTLTVLVGLTALINEYFARARFYNIDVRGRDDEGKKTGFIILALWLVSLIIAPFVTKLMAMMVSREREYLADASAAQFTRNPEALAHALEKIAAATAPTVLVKPGSAHLCIISPTATDFNSDAEAGWFATHPPIKMRIQRLMTIGRTMQEKPAKEET